MASNAAREPALLAASSGPNRITEIIQGKRGISAETALRLGRYFGTGAPFWLALQSQYVLETAERALGAKIAAEVEQAA